ncbi:hypothetical protein [Methylobacterium terricola]|nr:hypothetical protein [Methylobacterium terricola]
MLRGPEASDVMLVRVVSYGMTGVLAGGLAMTVAGTASAPMTL